MIHLKEIRRKISRQLIAIFFIITFPVLVLLDGFRFVGFRSLRWYRRLFKDICRAVVWKDPK
jgi:hypothetical protein